MDDQNPPPPQQFLLQIPKQILTDEVLPRLPVKSLFRFKCVSKSWKSMIESDRFMKIQYRNSAKNPRLIFSNSNLYARKECSLQTLLKSKEGSDPTKKEAMSGTLVGCFNGVVCCYDYEDGRFRLQNPAIRVSVELPDTGGRQLTKCGFGWDESNGAYKVFAVLYERKSNKQIGRVYSSNTNSWRTIPCGSLSLIVHHGVFLRGNLHWVIDGRHSLIECFDLRREEFGRIELPSKIAAQLPFPFPVLGEIGGSLSILIDWKKNLEVWGMKEYGVKDSWFKLLSFPPAFPERRTSFACYPVFGEGPNGEIFVCRGKNLAVYSPKDNAFSTARNHVNSIVARLYVESLVSPKRILDATNTTW